MQEEELIAMEKRCLDLSNELWNMPEYKLYRDLQGIDISISTFHNNYVILNEFLTFLTTDEQAHHLFTVRNHDKLHEAGSHVVLCLHNFVAAAQSLVEHSRNLYVGRLNKSIQLFSEYKERMNREFASDPLARFVICLRHYCQHYKAPSISVITTTTFSDSSLVRKVYLPLDSLRTYDGWNSEAKAYMKTIDSNGVDIQQVAMIYHDRVMKFHQWVQERHEEMYANEFLRFRAKEREVLLLQLEIAVEHYLSSLSKGNSHLWNRLDIFTHLLFSKDFARLEQEPVTPYEQACLAIALCEQKLEISLPERVKEKIFQIYEE